MAILRRSLAQPHAPLLVLVVVIFGFAAFQACATGPASKTQNQIGTPAKSPVSSIGSATTAKHPSANEDRASPNTIDLDVRVKPAAANRRPLRVASFNIFAGARGFDKVQAALRQLDVDVIGLQEVDRGTRRAGGIDQVKRLAKATGLHAVFAKTLDLQGGEYGLALLSRWTLNRVHRQALPVVTGAEPRRLLWAQAEIDGEPWTFAVSHFSSPRDAPEAVSAHRDQARRLAEALGGRDRVVLMADLNSEASATALTPLSLIGDFVGLQAGPSFPAQNPQQRLDHILLSRDLSPARVEVLDLGCSDHRVLRAEIWKRSELPQWQVLP